MSEMRLKPEKVTMVCQFCGKRFKTDYLRALKNGGKGRCPDCYYAGTAMIEKYPNPKIVKESKCLS